MKSTCSLFFSMIPTVRPDLPGIVLDRSQLHPCRIYATKAHSWSEILFDLSEVKLPPQSSSQKEAWYFIIACLLCFAMSINLVFLPLFVHVKKPTRPASSGLNTIIDCQGFVDEQSTTIVWNGIQSHCGMLAFKRWRYSPNDMVRRGLLTSSWISGFGQTRVFGVKEFPFTLEMSHKNQFNPLYIRAAKEMLFS